MTICSPSTCADDELVTAAARSLDAAGIPVRHLAVRLPSLDEAFLAITGHRAELDAASTLEGASPSRSPASVLARRNLLHVLSDPSS